MGCRREPNPEHDWVDFCYACAKALRSGDSEEVKKVMEQCENDGHQPWHALFRLNYEVESYYMY